MKQSINPWFIRVVLIVVCMGFMKPDLRAADQCAEWAGKVVSIQGTVEARKAGDTLWIKVKLNDTYHPGDRVRVQENSRAAVALCNDALLRLDQKTTITFSAFKKEKPFLLELLTGAVHFFSRYPKRLQVKTPFVNAAVEGTEFFASVAPDKTILTILEGQVAAANEAGRLVLAGGQSAVVYSGQAPTPRVAVRPRDAVHWALYYPPIVNWRRADFPEGKETDWQGMVRNSIDFYWKGDIAGAFSALSKAPEGIRDPRFFLYRGALFLTVGRVEGARADIARALNLDPSNSYAVALQSIIALVQNEKDRALVTAQKAVELDPESATAKVALSYVRQAKFDLNGALRNLQEAVKLDPENALAWARLAELLLSVGQLNKASRAARKAVDLNPNIARIQTVLGFALITRIKIKEALKTFQKAIALDSAAPLPRLGLGLAKIRKGDLKAGRGEIEIAASLDPNNSLIRSYLGKAYYDEKRDKLAAGQFEIAKQLDPQDPTPHFYNAIRKQTINRPVEALHDLQKSIELNDNRAIFRSRLQLDQDLAARSASLGRIYNDLGFQQLALVEGWKSVNTDPANYSAHRFLADSYSAIPRHEIARVSELLQSQLLQPINITPVQPRLAETNLFILEGAGPADPAFNEFNPLFLRNRLALQASGVAGENDTLGGEIVQSGVWGRASYSIGGFRYETDGFRENNDQDNEIYNVFAQYSLSPQTSVQAEFRHLDRETGQLDLLFDPDISLHMRNEERGDNIRVGFRHSFSPKSDLIGSIIYQSTDIDQNHTRNVAATPPVISAKANTDFKENRNGFIAELQHLLRTEKFNLTSGIGYTDQDLERTTIIDLFDVVLPFPPVLDTPPGAPISQKTDYKRANIYAYSQISIMDSLGLTVGLSAASLDQGNQLDRKQLNPKLGLTWQALRATIVRAAAFRQLANTRFFSQTIEPTQVAGFNQFFDDTNGTESWRYGAAVDQTFSTNLYGGIEYSIRDLDVPLLADPETEASYFNEDEQFGRAYLYWTPHNMLALSAEYQYERFDRKKTPVPGGIVDVTTHRVPLGFNLFHLSGITFGFKSTYSSFAPLKWCKLR